MAESMSKKEKLARGSAVIKVMKVIPRAGHYLNSYVLVHNMPRKPKPPLPKGTPMAMAEMPHLYVKEARFEVDPRSARANIVSPLLKKKKGPNICDDEEPDSEMGGFPEGHKWLKYFGYRDWAKTVHPLRDGYLAEHFNILLGLLMSMTVDPENANFADAEAYPCVQFLRTIKTPDGDVPSNIANLILHLEAVTLKMAEES